MGFTQSLIPQYNKVVSFLYVLNNGNYEPYGTGFLVSIPAKTRVGSYYIYLVTAKHVILDQNKVPLMNIYAKFNNTKDSSEMFKIDLIWTGSNKVVYLHSDSTIDLAVIPVVLPSNLDYKFIDSKQIIMRSEYEKENINIGTEIFFTGLFTRYIGSKTINPIFRFGKLCLIPNEKIEFDKINREILLIESSTFGGNSGSPVFFHYIKGNSTYVRLAGVVLGSFNQGQILGKPISKDSVVWSSLGISAITPSEFINDILNGSELVNKRKE